MPLYPHVIHIRISDQQLRVLKRVARRNNTYATTLVRELVQDLVAKERKK